MENNPDPAEVIVVEGLRVELRNGPNPQGPGAVARVVRVGVQAPAQEGSGQLHAVLLAMRATAATAATREEALRNLGVRVREAATAFGREQRAASLAEANVRLEERNRRKRQNPPWGNG